MSDIVLTVEERLAAVEEKLAVLHAALNGLPGHDGELGSGASAIDLDLIPLKRAAGIANRHPDTVRLWAKQDQALGAKLFGAWYIRASRLREKLSLAE